MEMMPQYPGKVIFICGKVENLQQEWQSGQVTYFNFMTSRSQLEKAFNESEIVLCRSGYTTIMDLVKLRKKAFFIPTPGQYEQLYLAEKLKKNGFFPYTEQENFEWGNLLEVQHYKGVSGKGKQPSLEEFILPFRA